MNKPYRIVENSYKKLSDLSLNSTFFVQELKSFMGFKHWSFVTERIYYYMGSGSYNSKIEFDTKDKAIAYVKWARLPLPKDKYTYI